MLDPPEAPLVAPDPEVAPPDVPGAVGDTVEEPGCAGLVPDTPVAGGVVIVPGPVPGAHGTAVPLVPVGVEAVAVAPVLRAVVFASPVGVAPGVAAALPVGVAPGDGVELVVGAEPIVAVPVALDGLLPAPDADGAPLDGVAAADPAALPPLEADAVPTPDPERGPASVAVFTPAFDEVVVPVELLIRLVGDVALPLAPAAPDVADAEPAPVTGTHGVVAEGEVALG